MSSDSPTTLCVIRPLTPCIQVCSIDSTYSLCQGCGRTLDEIACWGSMTEAEKAPVWERLEQTGYVDTLRPEEH
ncbi:DUF1289 domain-containing protein [Halomonas sp. GT]|uniref:DUF1289 domain-containing protein n=1 Tax=Halomonas sp. GT TaxID=1971364 RepID=UPI0009F3C5A0|nr:DUF1289 domain-containing protein [Halomonas sp. GT]